MVVGRATRRFSEIGSPVIQHPTLLVAMNGPSLDKFSDEVVTGLLDLLVDLHRVADRMHATEGAGPEAEG